MKKRGLTARQIQFMKPNPDKRMEVPAGSPSGLYLVVHPSGKKSWAFRYRYRGRPKKLTFAEGYPDMALARDGDQHQGERESVHKPPAPEEPAHQPH